MLIGYARVSKSDGNQSLDLRSMRFWRLRCRGKAYMQSRPQAKPMGPELRNCLKALRPHEDTLVVWKLDRLGRDLKHLVNIVDELAERGIGLKVLTGQGANIDTIHLPAK